MKMKCTLFALAAVAALTLLPGCLRDTCSSKRTFVRLDPVYKTAAECRAGFTAESPRALKAPGKIYSIGQYMLITELKAGIHVIDNSNPANPVPVAFWNIPGNVDMAVRDHYLYADQYIDLLTIDITDIQNPTLTCRAENVFQLFGQDPNRGYIVDYLRTEITEDLDCTDDRWDSPWFLRGEQIFLSATFDAQSNSGPIRKNAGLPTSTGISGSYSRFGQYKDYLYCIDNTTLHPFLVSDPSCPSAITSIPIGWNIETIFPWKDRLFIGSQSGLIVYNATNPEQPVYEASFIHATGCDPVVCDEDYAYVTIHAGTTCNGTFNQLDVINIKNLPATSLEQSYPMTNPQGLSVAGKYLYLCDDGLKVFDKTKPEALKLVTHLRDMETYDALVIDDTHLMVVGADGFYQYDVSDPANPKRISHIKVTP
ncbi:MAG: hypothetical protein IT260_00400 [Saprospiraceae bacterium]|nr:hypothetical protein [Saprospiraceae bacterium]